MGNTVYNECGNIYITMPVEQGSGPVATKWIIISI